MAVATKKQAVKETAPKEEKVTVVRPEELAKELGISGKQIRAWLRRTYTDHPKRTSWLLTPKQAESVRDHFTVTDDEDDE